jgi:choice-of-anchor B domain-containing protein
MKRVLFVLFVSCLIGPAFLLAQRNVELVSQLSYDVLLNDVWGYQAKDGTEYALVGLRTGISIVSLKDPAKPEEAAFVPGPYSIWRDLKTFGEFAYITADQGGTKEGMLVIDLRNLPDSVSYYNWTPTIQGRTLEKCHNLYIDERGIVYLAGCNVNNGGIVMADVAREPGQPELIGPATSDYAHDVFVQDGILYASEIYTGELGIYDVTDVSAPSIVSLATTPFRFTHNAWASVDGKTVFTTDERANAPVAAFDISNPGNARLLDQFRPLATVGQGVIPHNVHVVDNWLAISYYTDGAIIVDASRPNNLIEVGSYDTSPDFQAGFHGAWGAYPFLPSGLLLVADIETGLFVLKPDYVKACYLEGKVSDKNTGQMLKGVQVNILSDQLNRTATDAFGAYTTGIAEAGTFTVEFLKTGYHTERLEVQLKNGILTSLDVALRPKITYDFGANAIDFIEKTGVAGAQLMLVNGDTTYYMTANQAGRFPLSPVFEGTYELYVGAWGYQQKHIPSFQLNGKQDLSIELSAGYEDDFVLDLGWQSTGNAQSGQWVREQPVGTKFGNRIANPTNDASEDLGNTAYITGNRGGEAGFDDVDNGQVILQSPPFDVSDVTFPTLSFQYWFFNAGGEKPIDDTLNIYLANDTDTVLILQETGTTFNRWALAEFSLDTLIDTDRPLSLWAVTSDLEESGHIVEAGFDVFRITSGQGGTSTSDEEADPSAIIAAFPNPFSDQLQLFLQASGIEKNRQLFIFNALGQRVFAQEIDPQQEYFEWDSQEPAGIYFVHLYDGNRAVGKWKVIKE